MKLTAQQQAVLEARQQAQRREQAKQKFAIKKYKMKYYETPEEEWEQSEAREEEEAPILGIQADQLEEMMQLKGIDYNR